MGLGFCETPQREAFLGTFCLFLVKETTGSHRRGDGAG